MQSHLCSQDLAIHHRHHLSPAHEYGLVPWTPGDSELSIVYEPWTSWPRAMVFRQGPAIGLDSVASSTEAQSP